MNFRIFPCHNQLMVSGILEMKKAVLRQLLIQDPNQLLLVFNRRQDDLLCRQLCRQQMMFSNINPFPRHPTGLYIPIVKSAKDKADITVGCRYETIIGIHDITICWPMYSPWKG